MSTLVSSHKEEKLSEGFDRDVIESNFDRRSDRKNCRCSYLPSLFLMSQAIRLINSDCLRHRKKKEKMPFS